MNVVTTKNKVEQQLVEAFQDVADTLVGGADARKAAISRFEATGLPHRRIEEWKYTDLRNMVKAAYAPALPSTEVSDLKEDELKSVLGPLGDVDAFRVVFVDGQHQPSLDALDGSDISVSTLAKQLAADDQAATTLLADSESTFRGSSVVDLNTAFVTDGSEIAVARGAKLTKPIFVVHVASSATPVTTTVRHKISCGEGSEACVIEVFVRTPGAAENGLINTVSVVDVANGAEVSHIKCLSGLATSGQLANWHVTIGADANYRAFHFTAGCGLARSDGLIQFRGEGSKLDFSGVFLGREKDHIDTTLVIEHLVPHCESRELFKGVLDQQARGIFQGKVLVAQEAQKTDGKQMAQALMLSPDAEFDSKPELEIYADDVLCGHGSTSAELDDDLLFYLRSRGIPKDQARALLIESFVGEALECVEVDSVRDALTELARAWLAKV